MQLVLIRHTSLNIPKGICYGQTDVPVSDQFITEATAVQHAIAHYNFDAVYTSPLSRCVMLAEFCGFKDAQQDPRLMELNFGDWEMQPWEQITDPHLALWYQDWLNLPCTNGESFKDQYQRYQQFIHGLTLQQHQTIGIFTHGGILHCARIHAGIDTFENTFDYRPDYGEIITLNLAD